jgi:hypothetical protein
MSDEVTTHRPDTRKDIDQVKLRTKTWDIQWNLSNPTHQNLSNLTHQVNCKMLIIIFLTNLLLTIINEPLITCQSVIYSHTHAYQFVNDVYLMIHFEGWQFIN